MWLGFIHRDLAQEPKIERCLMEAKNKIKMNAFMEANNLREETGKAEKHKREQGCKRHKAEEREGMSMFWGARV